MSPKVLMVNKTQEDHLDVIDRYLLSDRGPDNSTGLSDLDGFLTGIVIGPELVIPSLMTQYNEIVRGFQRTPPGFDPVFWETKDGLVIAADWAEGFNDAIQMRRRAWQPLLDDDEGSKFLKPIAILCGDHGDLARRESVTESKLMAKATDELAASIIAIHAFWNRRKTLR